MAQHKEDLTKLQLEADIRAVLDTPAGLRLFKFILNEGRLLKLSVVADNPYLTYFNEGIRNFSLFLLDIIQNAYNINKQKKSKILAYLFEEEDDKTHEAKGEKG